jgi:hypothetical protein
VPEVVTNLFVSLCRYTPDLFIRAVPQFVELMKAEDIEQELPDDRERKVAFRKLDNLKISKLDRFAKVGEGIRVPSLAFYFAGKAQIKRALSDQIERDVGERNVLLENRPVPAPLGESVPEHQTVVTQSQEILEQVRTASCGGVRFSVGSLSLLRHDIRSDMLPPVKIP